MNAPRVITFGCRLNAFESEVLRERLGTDTGEVIVVNTCTVTAEAGRQARQAIRKARRENPGARIIVTGCAAQVDPEIFAAMPEVDRVVGNAAKLDPALLLAFDGARVSVADVMAEPVAIPDAPLAGFGAGFSERARAFVQIQQGCDHRCTFCIVPFARGPARSIPAAAVALQARRLVAAGYNEIVLTGVDISSYGKDLPGSPSLGTLARDLLGAVPELKRLRLSSLDPAVLDETLFEALACEERLMPHLHLSVQSLDDLILKRMKRRHDRAGAFAFIARARAARPGVSFGADLIAGFPTETEAMARNTRDGVAEAGVSFLHVFPYSPRPGTPAAKMPPVPAAQRTERAAQLRRAGEAALARFLESKVGATAEVLVESDGFGRAPDHAPVQLSFAAPEGSIVAARLARVADGALVGDYLA
ncbi:MAG: tRNA (N(6)-L-threonylcarbamoyladenosine(37)-C(2))-methylthiotransferase MtaB [Pseudomonadota bacterium]